ncbi:hypothetical protein FRB96_003147 [Tulasnella sp. 330]|nr:hypothetical protein FRB96_003147 [Tulasnella sp. 330]KAG8877252.1 hypothetical protein FRB97_003553 [Tulasnella sp. 331]KAG8881610.1 hypothetical protein FRB98_004226 [Tulasnella sp. 332]
MSTSQTTAGSSQVPQYPPTTSSLALPPQTVSTPPSLPPASYPQYPPYYAHASYPPGTYKPGTAYPYPAQSPIAGATAGAQPTTPGTGAYNPQVAAQTYSYAQQAQAYAASPYVYPSNSGYLNSPVPGTPVAQTPYPYGGAGTPAQYTYTYQQQQPQASAKPNVGAIGSGSLAQGVVPSAAAAGVAPMAAGGTGKTQGKKGSFKGAFSKDLRNMMYGFGDDVNPAQDSVNVMEEILMEYIADVCQTALKSTRKSTIKLDDLKRVLSRPADAKKLARMEELLFMQEDIKRARAQFDPADEAVAERMAVATPDVIEETQATKAES